jgi:acetolactate synthase-1/2/3 large subunit
MGTIDNTQASNAHLTTPTRLTGAEILWATLVGEGVTTVFGYPGGAILPAYDALRKFPIHHVLVRHEQGASHMADGYARASGKVGVAIATSGPGATNLVTGIATAMLDSIPIVCITGNVSSKVLGTDAFQEVDITGITLPCHQAQLSRKPHRRSRRCPAQRFPDRRFRSARPRAGRHHQGRAARHGHLRLRRRQAAPLSPPPHASRQ